MPTERLTPARLRNLKPPPSGAIELLDAHARGLSLRVFASGQTTWTFRYRPKHGGVRRRIGLGQFPAVGLAEARRRADRYRGDVSNGGDPQGTLGARRGVPTISKLIERYLAEEVAPKKKPKTLHRRTAT